MTFLHFSSSNYYFCFVSIQERWSKSDNNLFKSQGLLISRSLCLCWNRCSLLLSCFTTYIIKDAGWIQLVSCLSPNIYLYIYIFKRKSIKRMIINIPLYHLHYFLLLFKSWSPLNSYYVFKHWCISLLKKK